MVLSGLRRWIEVMGIILVETGATHQRHMSLLIRHMQACYHPSRSLWAGMRWRVWL